MGAGAHPVPTREDKVGPRQPLSAGATLGDAMVYASCARLATAAEKAEILNNVDAKLVSPLPSIDVSYTQVIYPLDLFANTQRDEFWQAFSRQTPTSAARR